MMEMNFRRDRALIEREFKERAWLEESGDAPEALLADCEAIWNEPDEGVTRRRARVMAYLLERAQIEVCPFECFADQLNAGNILQKLSDELYHTAFAEIEPQLVDTEAAAEVFAYTGDRDFGHTCPDWRALLQMGYPGLLDRLRKVREQAVPEQTAFYDNSILVYEAVLRYLDRLADAALKLGGNAPRLNAVAENLRALRSGPPQTLHQALQMTYTTYFVQQMLEGANVRSLGRFDLLFAPFYHRDLAQGRCTRDEVRELLKYYFCRWNAQDILANIPITLGGPDEDGREIDPEFACLMLEAYGELNIISPKFHIRCTPQTDRRLIRQVLGLIRSGSSSFVFCNDETVEAALRKIGQSAADARDYVMVGCYEPTSMGREIACTCNGRISIPKAVEYALSGGVDLLNGQRIGLYNAQDFRTFDEFLEAVRAQLCQFARQCMRRISLIEGIYPSVFSAPFFSGTLSDCVSGGMDAYEGGARYNNSSINAFGIATAADALAAIRFLVYEEKMATLAGLSEILKNNWAGNEKLRLICQKRAPKYGVGNTGADALARDLMDTVVSAINGRPNGRGGVFRAGAFSIDWRMFFGERTGASADGRRAHEPLSKNLSASLGQDTEGVTGLIHSAVCLDASSIPNGTVLDVVLHESAVCGEEGLDAMEGLIRTYMEQGGIAIQCNVLDANVLRKAQARPELYPTLQVRLCGWNVLFANLSRKEQDELILQAEVV